MEQHRLWHRKQRYALPTVAPEMLAFRGKDNGRGGWREKLITKTKVGTTQRQRMCFPGGGRAMKAPFARKIVGAIKFLLAPNPHAPKGTCDLRTSQSSRSQRPGALSAHCFGSWAASQTPTPCVCHGLLTSPSAHTWNPAERGRGT